MRIDRKSAIVIGLALLIGYFGFREPSAARLGGADGSAAAQAAPAAAESQGAAPDAKSATLYVCPMHAHIHSDHDGSKCPICGMALVASKQAPMAAASPSDAIATAGSSGQSGSLQAELPDRPLADGARIRPGVQTARLLGIRTAQVGRGDLLRDLRTIGKVTRIDSMGRRYVNAPTPGRLVYLSDRAEDDEVRAGELLFTVESDGLLQLERDFQHASQINRRDDIASLMTALRSAGISPGRIAELQQGAVPGNRVEVRAEEDAHVFERRGEIGDLVTTANTVYNLGSKNRDVEVTVEIFEQQWSWVEAGQAAEMEIRNMPGKRFTGAVSRVEPPVGYATRTLQVQLTFATDDPGVNQSTFVKVLIRGKAKADVLMVPTDAVIRTEQGERVVLIDTDGSMRSVGLVLGDEANGMSEVVSGLQGGETLVVSGQFLIDSESNRLAALRRLTSG